MLMGCLLCCHLGFVCFFSSAVIVNISKLRNKVLNIVFDAFFISIVALFLSLLKGWFNKLKNTKIQK